MINKELDEIMKDYVCKASDFCKDYEEHVLEKGYSTFSRAMEEIFEGLENELWRLKHNTEELIYISNDRFVCREADRQKREIIAINMDLAKKEVESVQHHLNTMHKYYLHRYSANIAKGLAEQWNEEAEGFANDLLRDCLKPIISYKLYNRNKKEGTENDN